MKKKKVAFGKEKKKDEDIDKSTEGDETTELTPKEKEDKLNPPWHPRPSND